MAKKLLFLITLFLGFTTAKMFSQENMIKNEELSGKWKIINGEGKDFDEGTIGGTFSFSLTGKYQSYDPASQKTLRGSWKLEEELLIMEQHVEEGDGEAVIREDFKVKDFNGKLLKLQIGKTVLHLEKAG